MNMKYILPLISYAFAHPTTPASYTATPITDRPIPTQTIPIPETTAYPIPDSYNEVAMYLEFNFDWANLEGEIQQALEWGYNKFYVGYYMSLHGCTGACLAWQDLTQPRRDNVKSMLAEYNAQIYLSLGGPGEFVEGMINDSQCASFGQRAGQFAAALGFDGVDVAVALSGEPTPLPAYGLSTYASNGSFLKCTQDIITGSYEFGYTGNNIQVSSHAAYFSAEYMGGQQNALSFLALESNSNQPWFVNNIGLDMINEADRYVTFQDIFISNLFYPGSAVLEIMSLGIDQSSIFVIKPISNQISMVRSDYVPVELLAKWGCIMAYDYGWYGGFLGYTWDNINGKTVQNFGQALDLSAC